MQALFRKNMYLADSDSTICSSTPNDAYIKKFKSGVLLAKSIGINPNMIIDSNGFESIVKNSTVKKFFDKKIQNIVSSDNNHFHINIHIFNQYVESSYFSPSHNQNENPFLRYYHEKIADNYLFSSFGKTKQDIEKNSSLRDKLFTRLNFLDIFAREIYDNHGYELFKIKNQQENKNQFRISLLENTERLLKEIRVKKNELDNNDFYLYAKALSIYYNLIKDNSHILNRSDFYNQFTHKEITTLSGITSVIIEKIKVDLVDTTYNSRFIDNGDIFRFQSLGTMDKIYAGYFDSYANNGNLNKMMTMYNQLDTLKSKFEVLNIIMNPNEIVNYVIDELVSKTEDKGISLSHKIASYIIPKTGLFGISESKKLLIGIK